TIQDARLGDLAEHLPAMFEDGFDREREQMIAATAAAPAGEISPEARDLLTRARANLHPAHYRVDGGVLSITADGHFTRVRSIGKQGPDDSIEARNRGILHDAHLRELVRYDGETLTATYPDQDLAVVRRVGLAEPALLSQWVPWLLPSPDSLARWYRVELLGTNTLRLHTPGRDERIDLELDAELRLVKLSRRSGERLLGETRFEYDARGLDIIVGEQHSRVELANGPADFAAGKVTTTLELPLRSAPDLATALARTEPGSPGWRAIQRQRLALLAALGQHHLQEPVLIELRAQGQLTRGELVLGGAGLILAAPKFADKALAAHPDDPVAAYLAALRRARKNQGAPLELVAAAHANTLPGLLASHARILLDAPRGVTPTSLARLRKFLSDYDHPELGHIATRMLTNSYDWRRPASSAPAWEALADADPRWRPAALHAAGVAYSQGGDWTNAAERFEQSLGAAVDTGQLPIIDWNVMAVVQRSGQARWRLQWSRWRAAVETSSDANQLLAFIAAADMMNEPTEVRRVLTSGALRRLDPAATSPLILQLVQTGLLAEAELLLRPLLTDAPEDRELLALAAMLAEQQGRLGDAADLAERALAAHEQLPLAQLRTTYRSILDLRARDASIKPGPGDSSKGAGQRHPLDLALDLAARWRAEDPDNAEIDERCAALLFALGQPAEAMRHLASIAERHPADGDAHAKIAAVLEREGRFAEADRSWKQAIAVEPTNPVWLIGRANNHLATDDPTTARALVEQVVAGKWQERFARNVEEARAIKLRLASP
ncbi:MAG: tetratricopeptide repeat protein, partial [Nannocystis sp.]